MSNTIIGEFSVLSPGQKRELERKRKEKEARETAEAIRKAEAARKAKEAAKHAEEERIAVIKAKNAEQEAETQKMKVLLCSGIVVLCVLIVIVIWLWIHLFNVSYRDWVGGEDIEPKIVYGIVYFGVTMFLVVPILRVISSGIGKCIEKFKEIK